MSGADPERFVFAPDGRFPNSRLPVLVYRSALPAGCDAAVATFAANGWGNAWIDGIFPFHHFHSIAHEVLGIAGGSVRVALGGPGGRTVDLSTGDALVIPAGVAHRNVGQAGALAVVGAYPGGGHWDVKRGDPAEFAVAARDSAAVSPRVPDPLGRHALPGSWSDAGFTAR